MSDHVYQAIENHLDHGLPGSAILINGPWGAGKTHYLKNILPPIAEAREMDLVWVSLYGLETAIEIVDLVAMGRMGSSHSPPTIGQQIRSQINNISHIFGSRFSILSSLAMSMYGRVIRKKTILIFDDIERISKKADLPSALGIIQTVYADNSFVKVICIGNESEIHNSLDYHKSKEKVFSHTIFYKDFSPAIRNISSIWLSDIGMNLKLEECISEIELFAKSLKLDNLRILILSLKAFKYFHKELGVFSPQVEKTLLYTLICMYKFISELEQGNLKKPSDVHIAFAEPSHTTILNKSDLHDKLYNLIAEGMSYQSNKGDLLNTYHDVEMFISPTLLNYCRFFHCDLILLKSELESLQIKIYQSRSSPTIQLIKKMQGAVWMTDDDFEKSICKFLKLLPSADFLETVSAASLVAQFEEYYPGSGVDFHNLKSTLLTLIDSSSTASIDHIFNVETILSRDIERINKREPEVAQAIRNRISIYRTDRQRVLTRTSWHHEFESLSTYNLCLGMSTLGLVELRDWYDTNLENRSRMDKIATFLEIELPNLFGELNAESKDGFHKLDNLLSSLYQSTSYGYISKWWIMHHQKLLKAAMGTV